MSTPKNIKTRSSTLAQISSESNLLEEMIACGSLNAIWQKTDYIQSLFETLPHGDKDVEIVQQRFEKMIRDTQEIRHQMEEDEKQSKEQVEADRRELKEKEEFYRKFEAQWQAFEETQRHEEKIERVNKILQEAEDVCISAEIDYDQDRFISEQKKLYNSMDGFLERIDKLEEKIKDTWSEGCTEKTRAWLQEKCEKIDDLKQQIQQFKKGIDDITRDS